MKRSLTLDQAAELCGLSRWVVSRYARRGEIPHDRNPGMRSHYRFNESELRMWFRNRGHKLRRASSPAPRFRVPKGGTPAPTPKRPPIAHRVRVNAPNGCTHASDVARDLGVGYSTVLLWNSKGKLPFEYIKHKGRRFLSDLQIRFIRNRLEAKDPTHTWVDHPDWNRLLQEDRDRVSTSNAGKPVDEMTPLSSLGSPVSRSLDDGSVVRLKSVEQIVILVPHAMRRADIIAKTIDLLAEYENERS